MQDPFSKLEEELNPKEEENLQKEELELQQCFRRVFSNYDGKKVLNVILNDLKMFDTCHNERDMALRNYATYLLMVRMGYNDTVSMTDQIINSKTE